MPIYSGFSNRGEAWDSLWNEYKRTGSSARGGIAYQKGKIGEAMGRDYWTQFQQRRFLARTQQFDDYARRADEMSPAITSGRRRGVGTSGAGGAYGRRPHTAISTIYGRTDPSQPGVMSAQYKHFEGVRMRQPGHVDFSSLSRAGREQLRNIAFEQFFDPRISAQQAGAAGSAAKTAVARGLRGKAVGGLSSNMARRFAAGNRRAALDFIKSDILQSQQDYAASTVDPARAMNRDAVDIEGMLARAGAFHMLSQGRGAFQGQSIGGPAGQADARAAGSAMLQGQDGSMLDRLRGASDYVRSIHGMSNQAIQTNTLRGTGIDLDTEIARTGLGAMRGTMMASAAATMMKEGVKRQYGSGGVAMAGQDPGSRMGQSQVTVDLIANALRRDLFSEGSYMSASDIVGGALDRDISARGGRRPYASIDTFGGGTDYRRLFSDAFSFTGGGSGQHADLLHNLTRGPRPTGSLAGMPGYRSPHATPAWMTPEISRVQYGQGSEQSIQDRMNYIREMISRQPGLAASDLGNYRQRMSALNQTADYLSDIRSRFLSPMSF